MKGKHLKKILYIIIALIVIVGIWAVLPEDKQTSTRSPESNSMTQQPVATSSDLIIGSKEAKAELVEYADFKCPSCGQFHQTASKDLRTDYISVNKLKLVFRPMAVIGPDSERSAVGAYCANDQNKFTEFHDAVYDYMWENHYKNRDYAAEGKDILTVDVLSKFATAVGVDKDSFVTCLSESAKKDLVANNQSLASQAGVRGTPTFSIAGQLIVGPQPAGVFKKLIEAQL